jgi:thioredoxin-related protein
MKTQFGIAVALAALWMGARPSTADIRWVANFQEARAQAAASNRPILISFYTDWCGWCKRLDRDVYPDRRVETLSRRFVMLRLNAEREGTALAQHFEVRGLPNIVLLQPSGQKMEQIPGYMSAADFARMMEGVLARVGPARAVVTRPEPATQPAPATRRPRTYTYGATSAEGRRRQTQALEQASGVMLLDNNGSRWLEPPTKKAAAKKKTRTAKNLQRRSRNSR